MTRRLRAAASMAAIVALTTSAAPMAQASGGRSIRQDYVGSPTETVVGDPFCDPSGHCLVPFQFRNVYTGDVVGTEVSAGQFVATGPADGRGSAMSVLTAKVAGCPGAGTVMLRWNVEFGLTTKGKNVGTFRVVPGTGTGGLSTIKGGGSFVTVAHPNGSSSSTFTAAFSCRPNRAGRVVAV